MRNKIIILVGVIAFLVLTVGCGARGPKHPFNAVIAGRITNSGHSVAGARVQINGYGAYDFTNSRGEYRVRLRTAVPVGVNTLKISVTASKNGFHSHTRGLRIHNGNTARINIYIRRR